MTFSYRILYIDNASVDYPAMTFIYKLCTDTGYGLEDLPGPMDDRDR